MNVKQERCQSGECPSTSHGAVLSHGAKGAFPKSDSCSVMKGNGDFSLYTEPPGLTGSQLHLLHLNVVMCVKVSRTCLTVTRTKCDLYHAFHHALQ